MENFKTWIHDTARKASYNTSHLRGPLHFEFCLPRYRHWCHVIKGTRLSPSIFADCKWLKPGGGMKLCYTFSEQLFLSHWAGLVFDLRAWIILQNENYMYLQIELNWHGPEIRKLVLKLVLSSTKTLHSLCKAYHEAVLLSESTSSKFKMQLWSLHTGPARHDMKLLRAPHPLSTFRDGLGTRLVPSLIPFSGSEYDAERTSYPS